MGSNLKFILFKYKKPLRIFAGLFVILIILLAVFVSLNYSNSNLSETILHPQAAYVPDELVVELKNEYTKFELETIRKKFEELGVIGQQKAYEADKTYLNNFYILKFKSGTDVPKVKAQLDATGIIEASHPNYILTIQDVPNDQYYGQQWDMPKIGMPDAWNKTKGSNNVTVAVIDTGIDLTHPDFTGRTILKGPNYANCAHRDPRTKFCLDQPTFDPMDDNGHGTHVAGTIGAVTNNGIGVAGMNWNVTLMAIKTVKADGNGIMTDNINGIQYAMANGAKIINLSLTSGKGETVKCSDSDMSDLKNTISDAMSQGIVVVVAAGNEDQDASNEIPPSCPGVITVGATDQQDQRWAKSNFGSDVSISAPGVGIISTYKNGTYASDNGTSMAAPHIAGAAALLLSQKPNMKPAQIKSCLVSSGDPISTDKPIGGVRLNVAKAVNNCASQPSTSPAQTTVNPTLFVPSPTTVAQNPTVTKSTSSTGTSTSSKTYTCRQAKGFTPTGAIQIGNLICTPN